MLSNVTEARRRRHSAAVPATAPPGRQPLSPHRELPSVNVPRGELRLQAAGIVGDCISRAPETQMAAFFCMLILVAVAAEDMVRFRIRNVAILALLACFGLDLAIGVRTIDVWPHLLLAGASLCILLVPFLLGGIGGGDAKLLATALLWVGPDAIFPFAVLLIAATLAYQIGFACGWLPGKVRSGRKLIPFGASISAAWIAAIALEIG